MQIREVDFPAALIEAHRARGLVIFVGAGASLDPPSNLLDFRELTVRIAAEAQEQTAERDLERADVFLGKLVDRQVNVHLRVAAHIGVSTSKPNRLHEALADLAVAGAPVRIVTTNYDLHLSTVLSGRGIQFEEYVGPALPMGNDFTGVVYLHGNLHQEPRRLVVTDADFGRAYLRDAWAARFLERMFATYTVVFVGYSHDDVVMRYLARALGSDAPYRYALTPTPDAPDWGALGIRPVGYRVNNESHAELVDAVEGWASRASMGLLDHRQRVALLVSAPPSQVPEEASYLEAVVADPDQVRLFADLARGEKWLSWAATRPEFGLMFDPLTAPTECTSTLAYWFAEHFVVNESHTAAALVVVQDAGGRFGPMLWSAVGQRMHMQGSPRPDWLGPWVVLLIQNAPEGASSEWLEYALVASRWPEDQSTALLLFDHLTEPQAQTRPSLGLPGLPRFDVWLRGSSHWLDEAWRELFVPNLTEAAAGLLAITDRHLRRAFQLLVAVGSARPGWDPFSFIRSAVERHPQDQYREPVDALIDAARDCLEALLNAGDNMGAAYLSAWADSEVPILRRLAVFGWVCRTDVDGTAKIAWLRERGWLFDHQLRHEVFLLIEVALPSAAGDVADALVADVLAGSDAAVEDHRAYEQFNALAWMKTHAPELQTAREAFERAQAKHPLFAERPHPDMGSWMEVGFVQPRPPMTAADLHERITANVADAIAELRRYEHVSSSFDGPTWRDALGVLVEAVRDHPADGFAVLDAAGGDNPDVVRGVISGWSAAAVDKETAEVILERLSQVDVRAVAEDLSRLLADGGRGDTNSTEWHLFPAAERLAADVWVAVDTEPPPAASAGRLAEFWVHAIAADWRAAGDNWTGMPSETRDRLDVLLAGEDARTAMAEVVFSSQVLFFFGADRVWCEAHVLPLLDWADPVRAQRTWDGYLTWGRWNDQLLDAGLLKDYLAAAGHLDDFEEKLRRQLCSHLAGVAVSSEVDPQWMQTFTRTVEPADRVEWMSQMAWMLDDLPEGAVEHQWQRWMRPYWQGRLESIPVELTTEEASAMATWVVYLTESIGEGVTLATAHSAGFRERTNILHDLSENRVHHAPAEFAKLIAHLMRGTQPPFWGGHYLAKIMPELRRRAAPADIEAIVEEAMRLGCEGAVQ
ncbi:MAG TPA: DUF4020 domain-containing protein [Dermatophilaceae bacterium]